MPNWHVWFDWATEEPLAIEAGAMTEALKAELDRERTPVFQVQAEDRRAAVRQVFPDAPPQGDPETLGAATAKPHPKPH